MEGLELIECLPRLHEQVERTKLMQSQFDLDHVVLKALQTD